MGERTGLERELNGRQTGTGSQWNGPFMGRFFDAYCIYTIYTYGSQPDKITCKLAQLSTSEAEVVYGE